LDADTALSNFDKADVYSFGVICWELITGEIPWRDMSAVQVVTAVLVKQKKLTFPSTDSPLQSIAQQCLNTNPSERPTFQEIVTILQQLSRSDAPLVTSEASNASRVSPSTSSSNISPPLAEIAKVCKKDILEIY
jgi:serine/threonine protein kinase